MEGSVANFVSPAVFARFAAKYLGSAVNNEMPPCSWVCGIKFGKAEMGLAVDNFTKCYISALMNAALESMRKGTVQLHLPYIPPDAKRGSFECGRVHVDAFRFFDIPTAQETLFLKVEVANVMNQDDSRSEPTTDIDRVVDALDRRIVPDCDRMRLRKAVDKADAPLTGRAGADEGLRGAIERTK